MSTPTRRIRSGLLRIRRERPRRRAAEQCDELAAFHVGHGGLLPAFANAGHQKAMALCGRFAAHLVYHGGGRQALDLERGQDCREVGKCDGKRVVVGIVIVFGVAVAAIIKRQHKPRLGIGRQRRCQGMKVGCSPGETR